MLWSRRRLLRMGVVGEDVARLQRRLTTLGYDPGPVDGCYGYLSHAAVRMFQREYALPCTGNAGEREQELLFDHELPVYRFFYTVRHPETPANAAEQMQVQPEALRYSPAQVELLHPGQQVTLFRREIWCMAHSEWRSRPTASVECSGAHVTGGVLNGVLDRESLRSGRLITQKARNSYLRVRVDREDAEQITHALLAKRSLRRCMEQWLLHAGAAVGGIWLDFPAVNPLDGRRYLRVVKNLASKLPKSVRLAYSIPWQLTSWLRLGHPLQELGLFVDQVVVYAAPSESLTLDSLLLERRLRWIKRSVAAWKILLTIPVYATLTNPDGAVKVMPYQEARRFCFRYAAHLERSGGDQYRFVRNGRLWQVNFVSPSSFEDIVKRINGWNAAGVILDGCSGEDPRIWSILPRYFGWLPHEPSGIISGPASYL